VSFLDHGVHQILVAMRISFIQWLIYYNTIAETEATSSKAIQYKIVHCRPCHPHTATLSHWKRKSVQRSLSVTAVVCTVHANSVAS